MDNHSSFLFADIFNFCACDLRRIIDGDTLEVDIHIGLGLILPDQRIRLYGVNCPEIHTKDDEEKLRGQAATQFVVDRLGDIDTQLLVQIKGKDNFGRWLGKVYYLSTDGYIFLNQLLLDNAHAVPTRLNLGP